MGSKSTATHREKYFFDGPETLRATPIESVGISPLRHKTEISWPIFRKILSLKIGIKNVKSVTGLSKLGKYGKGSRM